MSLGDDADLVRIERALNELNDRLRQSRSRQSSLSGTESPTSAKRQKDRCFAMAKAWVSADRARDRAFGADLFSDPAWTILLHLYIGQRSGQPCSVASLCVGSNLPQSTGLRWILALERTGMVIRNVDPLDRRRMLVSLTANATEKMESALV